jgi:hypothetical protein
VLGQQNAGEKKEAEQGAPMGIWGQGVFCESDAVSGGWRASFSKSITLLSRGVHIVCTSTLVST